MAEFKDVVEVLVEKRRQRVKIVRWEHCATGVVSRANVVGLGCLMKWRNGLLLDTKGGFPSSFFECTQESGNTQCKQNKSRSASLRVVLGTSMAQRVRKYSLFFIRLNLNTVNKYLHKTGHKIYFKSYKKE